MIIARHKKALPLSMGLIAIAAAIIILLATDFCRNGSGLWFAVAWFLLFGFFLIFLAFSKKPELRIDDDFVETRSGKFPRSAIASARVFRAWVDGGRGRYLELSFKEKPKLNIMWRVSKIFERFQFPEKDENGEKTAHCNSPLKYLCPWNKRSHGGKMDFQTAGWLPIRDSDSHNPYFWLILHLNKF